MEPTLPKAPWIYLNDTTGTGHDVANALKVLIPYSTILAEPLHLDFSNEDVCASELHRL